MGKGFYSNEFISSPLLFLTHFLFLVYCSMTLICAMLVVLAARNRPQPPALARASWFATHRANANADTIHVNTYRLPQ